METESQQASSIHCQSAARRAGAIAVVLIVHVLAFHTFLASRPDSKASARLQEDRVLTWITLPALDSEKNQTQRLDLKPLQPNAATKMDPGLVAPLVKPPNPLMSDVLRLQEPSPNALGDYVSCGLAKNGELWPDARKRCEELRASLYKGPVLPHVPTEAEELAARRFAHDKVVQGTPVLVPCFSPVIIGVSPICLINGLLNGFDVENAVYPEVGRPPSRREGLSRRAPLPDNMRR